MAKSHYKIPVSLDKSFADTEITLSAKDITVKPLPIKIVLGYIASGLGCFYVVTNTFITEAGFLGVFLFVLLWIFMTILLLKQDKTGVGQYTMVKSIVGYLPNTMRKLFTRTSNKATDFVALTGIADIDYEHGLIKFIDGSCANVFRVVGSGSVLLFEEDRDRILNRADVFYRKFNPEIELLFITNKESQKVYNQLANLKKRYDNLKVDDAELRAVLDTQFRVLKFDVGAKFKSIHQYLLLKAPNAESLRIARNTLLSEVSSSDLFFKRCEPLFGDDIDNVLKGFYQK